jgi:nitroreductase
VNERLRTILKAAIQAPSGDNCQPWTFHVQDNVVDLYNRPERDTSLYNVDQSASLVAHGALLENLQIAAVAQGLRAQFTTFPDPAQENLVARVTLAAGKAENEPLNAAIARRATNRRSYRGTPLAAVEQQALQRAIDAVTGTRLHLAGERSKIATVAKIIRLNDRLVFSNRYLHAFLFDHVRWNEREAVATRDGLDLKTLELNLFDRVGFRLLRNWPLIEKLGKVGVAAIASQSAQKLAKSASDIGLVTAPGETSEDLLRCGRAMQRVWLEATRLGLGFQLMTGITFLMMRVRRGATAELAAWQVEAITAAEQELRGVFRLATEVPVILFRVGHCAEPSARSLRLPLEQVVQGSD